MAVSANSIALNGTDNSNNESGFKIPRSTSATSGFATVYTTGPNVTTYTDTGLTASTTYHSQVKATNSVGDSNATGAGPTTTFPTHAENGLVAIATASGTARTSISDDTFTFTWSAPAVPDASTRFSLDDTNPTTGNSTLEWLGGPSSAFYTSLPVPVVPEPSETASLAAAGLAVLFFRKRRPRRARP